MTQEPQTQSRAGGSPDSSKIAAVERKMKENIFKMYDDLRARNDEFHQEERELLRGYNNSFNLLLIIIFGFNNIGQL